VVCDLETNSGTEGRVWGVLRGGLYRSGKGSGAVRCWDRDLGCRVRRLWKGRTMEEVEKIWLMERIRQCLGVVIEAR